MSGRYFRNFAVLSKNALSYSSPSMHEVAAAAEPIAAVEVRGDAADQHARIAPAGRQQPADQRRRRGLAVRAGDHHRSRRPQELLAHELRQRAVADLPVEHRFQFGIAARDRVADDDQVDVGGDVLGAGSRRARDALARAETCSSADRPLVGAPHVPAALLEHGGDRRHRRAADPDEMNAIRHRCLDPLPSQPSTAASSMTSAARPRATTVARTPNGSVTVAPAVWPDGNPATTGPGKSASTSRTTSRAVHVPAGLVAAGQLVEDDRRRRGRDARPAATASACDRAGTAARPLRRRTARARAADRTRTACRATTRSCVSVPPISTPRASPGRTTSSAAGTIAPIGSVPQTARMNESRS